MLEYFDLAKAVLVVVGAVIYFIFPVDLFPDMVPIVGHLDDLAILLAAIPSAVKIYKKLTAEKDEKKGA